MVSPDILCRLKILSKGNVGILRIQGVADESWEGMKMVSENSHALSSLILPGHDAVVSLDGISAEIVDTRHTESSVEGENVVLVDGVCLVVGKIRIYGGLDYW